jgi:hypothetical protein
MHKSWHHGMTLQLLSTRHNVCEDDPSAPDGPACPIVSAKPLHTLPQTTPHTALNHTTHCAKKHHTP